LTSASRRKEALPQDLRQAVYDLVHGFGIDELARLTNTSAAVIANKANPNPTTPHIPTLSDALVWQMLTKDHRILHTEARILGEICFPVPDLTRVCDDALLEHLTAIGKECGDFHAELQRALRDRRFTRGEFTQVQREAFEFMAAMAEMLARLEGLIDD
jgi:hypothetical protein